MLFFFQAHYPRNTAIVECPDNRGAQAKCHCLEKDILGRMAHLDMNITNTTPAIFPGGARLHRSKDQYGGRILHPALVQGRIGQLPAAVFCDHSDKLVTAWEIFINPGLKPCDIARCDVKLQRVKGTCRRRGAKTIAVGNTLRSPHQLRDLLYSQCFLAELPDRTPLLQGTLKRMTVSQPGSRQFDGEGLVWSTDYGDFGYRVKHWQPGGDTLLVLEVQRAPVPVPTSERDSLIDVLRERLQRRGGARQDWSKVPQWRPSVISLFVSEEGNLWVQTPTLGGATLFDHYDFNGSYLGSVASDLKLAAGIAPIVRGDQLWAVVTDDLDVQYVVRARIIPPPSAH